MKTFWTLTFLLVGFLGLSQEKISKTAFVSFYSETGGIQAENYSGVAKLTPSTGDLVISVAIQSFQFKNATMQKHFNQEDVMDSQQFPKSKFVGKITNNGKVDYSKDGEYKVNVSGDLTIKGKTNAITTEGIILIEKGIIHANATFQLDRFAYGVTGKEKSVSQILEMTVKIKFD